MTIGPPIKPSGRTAPSTCSIGFRKKENDACNICTDISIQTAALYLEILPSLQISDTYPDSKVHAANMGPIWGRQAPGPMNFAIWVIVDNHRNL